MSKYNKTLPSWTGLLLLDTISIILITLLIVQIVSTWGQIDSGFGLIVWVPLAAGLLALIGATHYFYTKRHTQASTKRTVLQFIFLLCLLPFILLVSLFIYSVLLGTMGIARQ